MVRMRRRSRVGWHLAGALLVSAVGCNLVLGNEKGHLAPEGEGGGEAEAGMGTFGGKAGSGGKRGGGGGPSAGEAGQAGNAAAGTGGSGGTTEPGDGGEPSDGGSTPARGGAPSAGGKANGGSGGAAPPAGGRSSGGTMGQGGSSVPPPMGGAQSCDPDTDAASCVSTSTVRYCDGTPPTWQIDTCANACSTIGFTSGSCPVSYCECTGPKNPTCALGARNYCDCNPNCTLGEYQTAYYYCFEEIAPYDEAALCWAEATSCEEGLLLCGGADG